MKWCLLLTSVGCAAAAPPVAPPAPPLVSAPEQIERTAAAVSCGPGLEIAAPAALATLSRTADSIVLGAPGTVIIVERGRRELGDDLRVVADALGLSSRDLAQPVTVERMHFVDERLLADVSIAGQAYQLARRRDGNCTAIGVERQPATGESVAVAIAGDMTAQPAIQVTPQLTPLESFVDVIGGLLRAGCWLDQQCRAQH